ncbi:phosphonate ABC transporter ATP-binding protein [Uliginosibacterium flavum]|uniref:Phosphonate ABC transporter ATP-binding protein n=1 Tax=Uliginosibacterium flavum TaxID=1396831 RepID=A0ABV2TPM5_9RHOO
MRIHLEELSLSYANGHAGLQALDLQVESGEQLAIIGPSGAGKTSLLRVLATALRPSSGRVLLGGAEPWALDAGARQRLRSRLGSIHQAPPLPPRQRVVTAVLAGRLGLWPIWKSLLSLIHPQDGVGALAVLSRVDLADKLFARCDQLSGGQLQRVGIARVLYQQAELMLADEPVSAMDPALADHTLAVLTQDAQQRGATLIASLHAVELALARFPRIVGLRAGRVLFDKPAAAVTPEDLAALYASERLAPVVEAPAPAYRVHAL